MSGDDVIALERVRTGIPGLDRIAGGGLPRGRTTLVTGVAGAGKSVLAMQYLAEGIRQFGEPGVFVTLAERPEDLRRNAAALGFDVRAWERAGTWVFVDASPSVEGDDVVVGGFDFSGLATRILGAVAAVGATRVSIDSVSAAFSRFAEAASVRAALQHLLDVLGQADVTAVITAEGASEDLGRFHLRIGEHVADSIVRLEYQRLGERRRRTLEVVKVRGGAHRGGAYPFTVRPVTGIVAIPLGGVELTQAVSDERVSTGDEVLDEMCGGGYFRDSVVLVAGATGTGKSLLATCFLAEGIGQGERVLLIGFEESAGQVGRNARNWGFDLDGPLAAGQLELMCRYPESASVEDHLVQIVEQVDRFQPHRLVIDSLTAVERIAEDQSFREFVMALTGLVKERSITGLYTAATEMFGSDHPTGVDVSVLADCIIVLRYAEHEAELQRVLSVLKMRGSAHDRRIRELTIDGTGLHIGAPLTSVSDILSSQPRGAPRSNLDEP